jgi:hypothetical protein
MLFRPLRGGQSRLILQHLKYCLGPGHPEADQVKLACKCQPSMTLLSLPGTDGLSSASWSTTRHCILQHQHATQEIHLAYFETWGIKSLV